LTALPSGFVGGIHDCFCAGAIFHNYNLRKNGYATEDSYQDLVAGSGHNYCYVQCDASQIVEGMIAAADSGQVQFWEFGNFNTPTGGGSIPRFMRHYRNMRGR